MIFYHKIGTILLESRINSKAIWIANYSKGNILGHNFSKFVKQRSPSDIKLKYFYRTTDVISLPILKEEEIRSFAGLNIKPHHGLSSPVARLPEILSKLRYLKRLGLDHLVEFHNYSASIYNFEKSELFLYRVRTLIQEKPQLYFSPIALSCFFPGFRSLLLHGAGVVNGKKAIIFLAPNGGGKTTAAKLMRNHTILSDDHVILKVKRGSAEVFGSPWGRYTNAKRHGILSGIFLLEKANTFSVENITKTEMIEYLWKEHHLYYWKCPLRLRIAAFHLINDFVRSAPVYRLKFSKDYIDWEYMSRLTA